MYGRKLENYKRSQFRCRLSYSKHGARFLLPKHVNKIGQHPRAALETPEDPPVDNLALPATKSSHFWVVSQKLRNLSLNPGTPLTFHFVSSQTTFIENGNPPPPAQKRRINNPRSSYTQYGDSQRSNFRAEFTGRLSGTHSAHFAAV